jgi:L-rhamnose-H+ transport protein
MIQPDPLLGTALHAIGAFSAAICYTPQKSATRWSWQTFWLAQATVCWVILPGLVAWLTVPQLAEVLAEAPRAAMIKSFALGALYGVGGTAFGVAIRYLGVSLTYAIAIGISCVMGTLLPPVLDGTLGKLSERTGAGWIFFGVALGALGILISGWAGRLKESDLAQGADAGSFQLGKGLALCVLAGVLSAVFGLALGAGQPIAEVAAKYGAGVFEGNVIYIFACGGAFVTTSLYCLWLHIRDGSAGEYRRLAVSSPVGAPVAERPAPSLPGHYVLAALTGLLWYGQFFFYGLGHVRMGDYKFTSWAVHMIMLVLISAAAGLWLREWSGCRPRTHAVLAASLVVLLVAVLALTYGNHLADVAAGH